jgi:outer membrane protein assembly factor BamB
MVEKSLGGSAASDPGDGKTYLLVEAFRRSDGERLWEYRFEAEGEFPEVHRKTNMANPSPVTDGELIYAWFATGQLVALDTDGKLVWHRHLARDYSPFEIGWGHSSSPTLYKDLILLLCDHTPASYLLALDKKTGAEKWKVERGKGLRSYSTPFVAKGVDRDELIVNSSKGVDAYDPSTGEHFWFLPGPNRFPVPSPSYDDGVLYMNRGHRSGPYMALKTGGKGDISTTHVQWRVETGAPYVSSVVYYEGLVYMANGVGVVRCVDGKTGERVWQERIGGVFSASPVAADGKIYLLAESGEMVVLKAGRQPVVLSRNNIDERSIASPAISNGQIFIRTDDHLVCVGPTAAVSTTPGRQQPPEVRRPQH